MSSEHAPSLYAADADHTLSFPRLMDRASADVAIVGGGYTGLSAALHLAEAGVDVILLEAASVGWGASGRNGGQLHSGQRRDQDWLEDHLGLDEARRLWMSVGMLNEYVLTCPWQSEAPAEGSNLLVRAIFYDALTQRSFQSQVNVK